MKKIALLTLFFLFTVQCILAQKSLVGSYQISSTNPYDVVSHWLLFDNGEFAVVRASMVVSGTYEEKDDGIDFTPSVPKEPFHVFGRYNKDISGTRIMLKGVDLREPIYLATSNDQIYSVFKKDARCLPSSLRKIYDESISTLILANYVGDGEEPVNKFNSEYEIGNFNDFIIIYFNSQTILPPFRGKISKNKLRVEYGLSSYDNLIVSESDEFNVSMSVEKQQKYFKQDSLICDNEYNFVTFSPDLHTNTIQRIVNDEDYDFNTDEEVFTMKSLENGEEKMPADFEKLFVYKMLQYKTTATTPVLAKKSLFDAKCR